MQAANISKSIKLDGINGSELKGITHHVACVKFMKDNGFLNQTLISQNTSRYRVGEPGGGVFRGYTAIFETLIPA